MVQILRARKKLSQQLRARNYEMFSVVKPKDNSTRTSKKYQILLIEIIIINKKNDSFHTFQHLNRLAEDNQHLATFWAPA